MQNRKFINNSHNRANLAYHFVCPTKIITTIKSLTARRMFVECPEVKKLLLGGQFWSDGYFCSTVGKNTSEKVIKEYVKKQGKQDEYKQLKLSL